MSDLQKEMEKLGWKTDTVKIKHDPERDRTYLRTHWILRKHFDGKQGAIVDTSGGHGRCFVVWVDGPAYDQVLVTYDAEELTPVEV